MCTVRSLFCGSKSDLCAQPSNGPVSSYQVRKHAMFVDCTQCILNESHPFVSLCSSSGLDNEWEWWPHESPEWSLCSQRLSPLFEPSKSGSGPSGSGTGQKTAASLKKVASAARRLSSFATAEQLVRACAAGLASERVRDVRRLLYSENNMRVELTPLLVVLFREVRWMYSIKYLRLYKVMMPHSKSEGIHIQTLLFMIKGDNSILHISNFLHNSLVQRQLLLLRHRHWHHVLSFFSCSYLSNKTSKHILVTKFSRIFSIIVSQVSFNINIKNTYII